MMTDLDTSRRDHAARYVHPRDWRSQTPLDRFMLYIGGDGYSEAAFMPTWSEAVEWARYPGDGESVHFILDLDTGEARYVGYTVTARTCGVVAEYDLADYRDCEVGA